MFKGNLLKFVSHGAWAFLILGVTACVDNDYDLTKDIDYTVTVGGDLSIPGSNTEAITLKKILDMDETSIVKADENGFYSLVKSTAPQQTDVKVDSILFNNEMFDSEGAETFLEMPQGMFDALPEYEAIEYPVQREVTSVTAEKTDVTDELLAIDSAVTELPMDLEYRFLPDNDLQKIYLKAGYQIDFPDYVVISEAENTDKSLIEVRNGKSIFFKKDLMVNENGLNIPVMIRVLDFTNMPEGSGFTYPSKMKIDMELVSEGQIYFYKKDFVQNTNRHNIHFMRTPRLREGKIMNCKVKVQPEINIEMESIQIDNLPDFLSDEDVVVDLVDPKFYVTVTNSAPVDVNLNATITAHRKDGSSSIQVGDKHGIPVVIPKSVENYVICFHKQNTEVEGADQSIQLTDMDVLIEKIPQYISIDDIESNVPDRYYYVRPGRTYSVLTETRIDAPLTFGEKTNIVYRDTLDGWHEDLDKYDMKAATITMDAVNAIPLNMKLDVQAIDVNGNEIPDIVATVDKSIAAGYMEQPITTTITIQLTSQNGSISKLDGLLLIANATSPATNESQQLNENQTLTLTNVRVSVKGGVKIDLN